MEFVQENANGHKIYDYRTSFECCCYIYGSSMTLIKGNKRNFVDTRALKHCKAMGINGNQVKINK